GVETFGVGQVGYAALGEVEVVVGVVDAFEHDGGLGRFGHLQCVGGALYPQFADHGGQTFFLHRGVSSGRGPAQGVADQGGQASGIVGPGGLAQIRAGTVVGLFHGDVWQAEERPWVVGRCVSGRRVSFCFCLLLCVVYDCVVTVVCLVCVFQSGQSLCFFWLSTSVRNVL